MISRPGASASCRRPSDTQRRSSPGGSSTKMASRRKTCPAGWSGSRDLPEEDYLGASLKPYSFANPGLEVCHRLLVPRAEGAGHIGAGRVVALRVLADAEILAHDGAVRLDGPAAVGLGRRGRIGEIEMIDQL